MDTTWVLLREGGRSWHIEHEDSKTYCGLASAGVRNSKLGSGKSCENCLRIFARQNDVAEEDIPEAPAAGDAGFRLAEGELGEVVPEVTPE